MLLESAVQILQSNGLCNLRQKQHGLKTGILCFKSVVYLETSLILLFKGDQ